MNSMNFTCLWAWAERSGEERFALVTSRPARPAAAAPRCLSSVAKPPSLAKPLYSHHGRTARLGVRV